MQRFLLSSRPWLRVFGLAALSLLTACQTGGSFGKIQPGNTSAAQQKAAVDPNIQVMGKPAEAWAGGNCMLGALEIVAYDGLSGQRLDGVIVQLSGTQFDGKPMPQSEVRLPSGFAAGDQDNSQPRSYQVDVTLPPGYVHAAPKRFVVHYDCRNRVNRIAEFQLYRTMPQTEVATGS